MKVNGLKIFKGEIRRFESFKRGLSNNFEVSHQIIEQKNNRYYLTLNQLSIIAPELVFFILVGKIRYTDENWSLKPVEYDAKKVRC